MNGKEIKKKLSPILNSYKREGFSGRITRDTDLKNLFGVNQWSTLGAVVIGSELMDKFSINIDISDLLACKTVGDLINFIDSTIKEAAVEKTTVVQAPAAGIRHRLLESISAIA